MLTTTLLAGRFDYEILYKFVFFGMLIRSGLTFVQVSIHCAWILSDCRID